MSNPMALQAVTELHGLAGVVRQAITELITQRTGSTDITFDFYREWSGGWRVAITVQGRVSGQMDFILLHTPQGGILAMPAQLPERWRSQGVPATDGSVWTMDAAGQIVGVK